MLTSPCSNLPLGGIALLIIPWFVRPKPSDNSLRRQPLIVRLRHIDWLGTLLFTGSFTCLFLALQWGGQTKPWRSSVVIGLFVGFALHLAAFVISQRYTGERSLIPPTILKQRTVLFGTVYLILFGLQMAVVSTTPVS
jgi:hypothetical protein